MYKGKALWDLRTSTLYEHSMPMFVKRESLPGDHHDSDGGGVNLHEACFSFLRGVLKGVEATETLTRNILLVFLFFFTRDIWGLFKRVDKDTTN